MTKADLVEEVVKVADVSKKHAEIIVNTVSTGSTTVGEFDQIAEAGGGRSLLLRNSNGLIAEILLLIFGDALRPAMERFVPALLEILAAQEAD